MNDRDDWRTWASCKDEDTESFFIGAARNVHEEMINQFCSVCPVAIECLEDATQEDLAFSVRGGFLPGERIRRRKRAARARKPGSKPRPSRTQLDRGICNRQLHKLTSEDDLRGQSCKKCYEDIYPVRLVVGGVCGKGHTLSEENTLVRIGTSGNPLIKCRECKRNSQSASTRRIRGAAKMVG